MSKKIKSISDLKFDTKNANKGTATGQTMVDQSVARFGSGRSIVADKHGNVIGGNKTLKSAIEAGLEVEVVRTSGNKLIVHQREDLDLYEGDEARLLAYMDNRSSEVGLEWDADQLTEDITAGLDLGWMFSEKELDEIGVESLKEPEAEPEAQMDAAEELQEKWQVKDGDIWQIGEHRLMCGDNSSNQYIDIIFSGELCDLIFTSPPYGQQREYGDASDVSDWDQMMVGAFQNTHSTDKTQILVNLGLIYKNGDAFTYWDRWLQYMRTNGNKLRGWYVWDKLDGIPGTAHGRLRTEHEWVFHFSKQAIDPNKVDKCKTQGKIGSIRGKDGIVKNQKGISGQTKIRGSVARVTPSKGDTSGHPATFPDRLPRFYIESWDGLVYDPFLGSGTTMVAAQQLGRKCYGMEIEPKYCAVILERMSDMGLVPELVSNAREA